MAPPKESRRGSPLPFFLFIVFFLFTPARPLFFIAIFLFILFAILRGKPWQQHTGSETKASSEDRWEEYRVDLPIYQEDDRYQSGLDFTPDCEKNPSSFLQAYEASKESGVEFDPWDVPDEKPPWEL